MSPADSPSCPLRMFFYGWLSLGQRSLRTDGDFPSGHFAVHWTITNLHSNNFSNKPLLIHCAKLILLSSSPPQRLMVVLIILVCCCIATSSCAHENLMTGDKLQPSKLLQSSGCGGDSVLVRSLSLSCFGLLAFGVASVVVATDAGNKRSR